MSLKKEVDELKDIMHGMLQKMKEQQAQINTLTALMRAPDINQSVTVPSQRKNKKDVKTLTCANAEKRTI